MATAKSDDDNEERSHPLARERPGVYVQVVSPRRRKGRPSVPAEEPQPEGRVTAVAEVVSPSSADYLSSAIDAQPKQSFHPAAPPEPAPDTERPSGERPVNRASVISVVPAPARFASENSNGRADLVVVSLPPPPRLPSFDAPALSRDEEEDEEESALDVAHTLRPSAGKVMGLSWPLLVFIAALSAIAASAGVVAWRGSPSAPEVDPQVAPAAPVAASVSSPVPSVEPLAVPEPSAAALAVKAAEPAATAPVTRKAPMPVAPAPSMQKSPTPPTRAVLVPVAAPKLAATVAAPVRVAPAPAVSAAAPAPSEAPAPSATDEPAESPTSSAGPAELPENPYE